MDAIATSVITNTITDPAGTAIAGVRVVARLVPPPCFRTADGSEIDPVVETTTNGSGVWSLTLEETAGISPSGSHYEIVEYLPSKPRTHTIQVGASNQSLYAALVTPPPAADGNAYLTQASADARYQELDALGGTPEAVNNAAGSNGASGAAARADHKHALATGYRLPYVGSSAPSNPATGDQWTHSSTLRVCVYDGTGWRVIDEDWQNYASSVTFSNFTLGDGSVAALYKRQGLSVVYQGRVILGSTSSMSTTPGVSAPFASTASHNIPGAGYFNDATANEYGGAGCRINSGGQFVRLVGPTAAVSSTSPFTWTTSDAFSWSITYPISAADARAA